VKSTSEPARISASQISELLFFTAMMRGVSPLVVILSNTGLYFRRVFTAPGWLFITAKVRGVIPASVSVFISAPLEIRRSISDSYPFEEATRRL
jgi:hypothetical protein